MNLRKYLTLSLFVIFLLCLFLYFFLKGRSFDLGQLLPSLHPEAIRQYISSFGAAAIVVYIILYTINTITMLPPIAIMSLSAGALFGPIWGTVALSVGAACGVSATFVISRFFRGPLVERFVKGRVAEFNKELGRNGFLVLLPMRLVGIPPYEFVNYASGFSKITYRDYLAASMLGMSPAIIIQVLLADRLANFSWKDPFLYIAIVIFILMIVITGKIVQKRLKVQSTLS